MVPVSKFKVKMTFVEPLLGAQPGSKTPAEDHLRKKALENAPDGTDMEDEAETFPELMEKGTTGFHRDADGSPMVFNYAIHGMLKEAASKLNGTVAGIKGFRSKVEFGILIQPRRIKLVGEMGDILERPLRATDQMGRVRTALSRSETMKPGTYIEFEIHALKVEKFNATEHVVRELMDFAQTLGFGQWRNSKMYGQFEYTLEAI